MWLTVTLRAGILMVPLLAGGLALAHQAPTSAAPGQRGAGRGAQGPRVVSPEILPDMDTFAYLCLRDLAPRLFQ